MTPSLKAKIIEKFRDRFTYANFTWNGEVHDGVDFAKKQLRTFQKHLLSACQSSYEAGQRSVVEAVRVVAEAPSEAQNDFARGINFGCNLALEAAGEVAHDSLDKKP